MVAQRRNFLEILALTPKDNCGDCGVPSCSAFAVQVSQGALPLQECPHITGEIGIVPDGSGEGLEQTREPDPLVALEEVMARFRALELSEVAARVGAPLREGRLEVRCLGRRFQVDGQGKLHSECHLNGWVHLPILQHLIRGRGQPLSGEWVPFAKLEGGQDWTLFFTARCEQAFVRYAKRDPELLCSLLGLFGRSPAPGRVGAELRSADHLAVLEPLPGVALLFRVWKPDEEFDAEVSLLFDRASTDNVDAGSLYTLTRGLVEMFKRLALRHGSGEV